MKRLQEQHGRVLPSSVLSTRTRKVLVRSGRLQRLLRGWYITLASENVAEVWQASFWQFLGGYLRSRFSDGYCLNPQASILLQVGNLQAPKQVTAVSVSGGTNLVKLPFNHVLRLYKDTSRIPEAKTICQDVQVWSIAEALCLVSSDFWVEFPAEAKLALQRINDASELLPFICHEKTSRPAAERLAGAFEFVGRSEVSDAILKAITTTTITSTAKNPFGL